MPRIGSIVTISVGGGQTYEFTPLGLIELQRLTLLGTPIGDLAEYFDVSYNWMQKQLATNDIVKAYSNMGAAEGKQELRQAAHDAAKAGDSRVLTFMLERRLGMNKVTEQKVEVTHKVIGTMPVAQLESESWFERYAPTEIVNQELLEAPKSAASASREADGTNDEAKPVHSSTSSEAWDSRDPVTIDGGLGGDDRGSADDDDETGVDVSGPTSSADPVEIV